MCMSCQKSFSPKYAVVNGFVIGEFSEKIRGQKPKTTVRTRNVDIGEFTDELKAILAAIRPYGYVLASSGGVQKSISGHYAFFETDQYRVSGAITHMQEEPGAGENVHIMLCGHMTPAQKQIVQRRVNIDSKEYFNILHWFITESGHPCYSNLPVPE